MRPHILGFALVTAATAAGYWIVGAICMALVASHGQSVPVWLGAGLIFGALLAAPARYRAGVVIGALVASYVWGLFAHSLSVATALPFALIEVGCAAVGACVAALPKRQAAKDVMGVSSFLAGALLTALLGATLAAELWRAVLPNISYSTEWRTWAFSTLVGVLLVAPVLLEFRSFHVKRSGGMPMSQFLAGGAAYLAFLVIAWIVFGHDVQERFGTLAATLAYLPMPALLLSALLWGPRGGSLAMLAGSLLVIAKTGAGGGPFAVADGFADEAVVEVQVYVAVWVAVMLIMKGLTESRRVAKLQATEWQLRYERILGATRTASVEFDSVTGKATWGAHAGQVFGQHALSLQSAADWLDCIDTHDRARARLAWDAVVQGQQESLSAVYAVKLGDRLRRAEVELAGVRGPDGSVERLACLMRLDRSAPTESLNG